MSDGILCDREFECTRPHTHTHTHTRERGL